MIALVAFKFSFLWVPSLIFFIHYAGFPVLMGVLKEERDDVEMVANLSLFLYSMTYLISLRYLKLLSGYLEGKLILKLFVVC